MHNLTPTDMDPSVERRRDKQRERGVRWMEREREKERERLYSLSPCPLFIFSFFSMSSLKQRGFKLFLCFCGLCVLQTFFFNCSLSPSPPPSPQVCSHTRSTALCWWPAPLQRVEPVGRRQDAPCRPPLQVQHRKH